MSPAGRPTDYDPKYCEEIVAYFDIKPTKITHERFYYKNGDEKEKEIEVANELPTLARFAHSIDVNRCTLREWADKYPEFSAAYKRATELQEDIWQKNALKGLYNPAFAIFMGKNVYGWRDKREVEQTLSVVKMPTVTIGDKKIIFDVGEDKKE